jgi:hypothetical protein
MIYFLLAYSAFLFRDLGMLLNAFLARHRPRFARHGRPVAAAQLASSPASGPAGYARSIDDMAPVYRVSGQGPLAQQILRFIGADMPSSPGDILTLPALP